MITPASKNITIYQGATFFKRYTWKSADAPVDLTAAEIRMQVRQSVKSAETLIDATTSNGLVVIDDPTGGSFHINIPATETDLLSFNTGVYDIEIDLDGYVYRLVEGRATLSLQVTR